MRARAAAEQLLGPLLEEAGVGLAVLDAGARYLYVNSCLASANGTPVERHLGRTIHEVIPHVSATVAQLHSRVLASGSPVLNVQAAGTTPGALQKTWQVSYLPLEAEGRPAVGVVLIDVSERQRAMADASRRARQSAAVADLGQLGLSGGSAADLLTAATDAVTRELDADFAGVLEFAETRDHLVMCAGTGWPEGAVGAITAQVGLRSQAGFTLVEGGPVVSDDLATESRFHVSGAMRAQGARSAISTPIPGDDAPFGVLGVFSRRPSHFDRHDAGFVRAVANVLGAAVMQEAHERALETLSAQRGRLVAQGLDAGEREQRQVADVLHDDVLQHLLFARQELADAGAEPAALERARASVDEAAELLRRVVAGLHPVTLAHAGLAAALETLARDHSARAGVDIAVEVEEECAGEYDRLLLSLARELLTNVAKHAQASRAAVSVRAAGGWVELRVADDGVGLRPDAFDSALAVGSIGLAAMRERAEALGGNARIGTGLDGRGATVEIRLPL